VIAQAQDRRVADAEELVLQVEPWLDSPVFVVARTPAPAAEFGVAEVVAVDARRTALELRAPVVAARLVDLPNDARSDSTRYN
jgi:hypothetical protein